MLVLLVLASAFSQSPDLSSYLKSHGLYLSKAKVGSASSLQSPLEKSEKEEKQSVEEKLIFVSFVIESVFVTPFAADGFSLYSDTHAFGNKDHTPLYLLIRTLII
jgi:hypothetical protein